ncbi:hypothetical protein NBRC3280_3138 [Acetobacter pasteurianus NBRC 3280]|uniref:Uncharacterized protein n=3 Tax=Acetobacter pasteurianus TaxID=438 RepID=A0A1Y0Y2B4_ACEPA|nr:hypothetical protein S1001342_03043 [Acetobacter pasteurianus subsp. pasteurianus]OAZ76631.1 hypothetical protein SRCM100623_00210 [Acetobacter pasteurianus]GCD60258.1 hypothetical protein NBRC3277_2833 [Acetobacter pasteurianus NBRC 3277]GCD64207.1 hypothetical protein NBRC3278_3300 [Acetobacter pasteurianus NBRC 3278]GCD70503.1 hypothetical protein NBRC3280_3138 [Acetobacter pasteurianus NBRC 3280]
MPRKSSPQSVESKLSNHSVMTSPVETENIVIAPNGSPHKTTHYPRTSGDNMSKHQRYYARNRELVCARQREARRRKKVLRVSQKMEDI